MLELRADDARRSRDQAHVQMRLKRLDAGTGSKVVQVVFDYLA